MRHAIVIAVILALASLGNFAQAVKQPVPSILLTQQQCYTKYGGYSSLKSLPTQTNAYTKTAYSPIFVQPTVTSTVTPPLITAISSSIVTLTTTSTNDAITDTFTSTIIPSTTTTSTSIAFSTTTITTVSISQITAAATTTTVIPGANFTPVSSQLSDLGYSYTQRRRRRSNVLEDTSAQIKREDELDSRALSKDRPYPQFVECVKHVEKIIYTTTKTSSSTFTALATASPLTTTKVIVSTRTLTSIDALPDVLTTITIEAPTSTLTSIVATTQIITSTIVQIQTQTIIPPPLATIYTACRSDNMVNNIAGDDLLPSYSGPITGVTYPASTSIVDSALNCCNTCQMMNAIDPTTCFAFTTFYQTCRFYLIPAGGMASYSITQVLHGGNTRAATMGNAPGGSLTQVKQCC